MKKTRNKKQFCQRTDIIHIFFCMILCKSLVLKENKWNGLIFDFDGTHDCILMESFVNLTNQFNNSEYNSFMKLLFYGLVRFLVLLFIKIAKKI